MSTFFALIGCILITTNNGAPAATCEDQMECLEVESRLIEEAGDDTRYEICLWFNPALGGCRKEDSISHACNSPEKGDKTENWKAGQENELCQTVNCDDYAYFGIKDGRGCGHSTPEGSFSFSGVDGIYCFALDNPKSGYCAGGNKAACTWKVPSPECPDSDPTTTTEAPPETTEAPPTTTEAPPATTEAPPATTEASPTTTIEEAPTTSTEAPPATTDDGEINCAEYEAWDECDSYEDCCTYQIPDSPAVCMDACMCVECLYQGMMDCMGEVCCEWNYVGNPEDGQCQSVSEDKMEIRDDDTNDLIVEDDNTSGSTINVGSIVGWSIFGVFMFCLLIGIGYYCCYYSKKKSEYWGLLEN